MFKSAKWIWKDATSVNDYNTGAVFRREFELDDHATGEIDLVADSFYRLSVNGVWVADGPARAYPEHCRVDRIKLDRYLKPGKNELEIIVRYFGCGTFHQLALAAGLIVELRLGSGQTIVSDETFYASDLPELLPNTAKNSVQRPPFEVIDGRYRKRSWHPAIVREARHRNFTERDCAFLTRKPLQFRRFVAASAVPTERKVFTFSSRQLYFPGTNSENCCDHLPFLFAQTIESDSARELEFASSQLKLALNGDLVEGKVLKLRAGKNLLAGRIANTLWHPKEYSVSYPDLPGLRFGNPIDNSEFPALALWEDEATLYPDIPFPWANRPGHQRRDRYEERTALMLAAADGEKLRKLCDGKWHVLTAKELRLDASSWSFLARRPEALPADAVTAPEALITGSGVTRIEPVPGKDIELLYDLGEESCGYLEFVLSAPAGTVVDIAAVEYITPTGTVQFTGTDYRNGMRYICGGGVNCYLSLERRAGRYFFVTLRKLAKPVEFHSLRLVESTYPAIPTGSFDSSDARLNKIFEISERTLKLCMEDTYTDCPLYEQTLWVGDARNEALFGFGLFGAYDLARRCIRIAGESLDRYPITGCQVPSGWDCLLPAWSFMWGISVWDYYFETGDAKFTAEVWPMVRRNLDGALSYLDEATGLFRIGEWNLFDWSPTNCEHEIMVYNSMFLAGAIDAALACAEVIGKTAETGRYAAARLALKDALAKVYDRKRGVWPDSIENGKPSADAAVHTAMLAVLFSLEVDGEEARIADVVKNPPADLIGVSSPFAALYYYMALEKLGCEREIIKTVYRDYLPMLKLGSTTVWETFPGALNMADDAFPTRSHCHGWSAAPLYFLPRIVLGLRMIEPGAAAFEVSPVPGDLSYANGVRQTVKGPIEVRWELYDNVLRIAVRAPADVEVTFRSNPAIAKLDVDFRRL